MSFINSLISCRKYKADVCALDVTKGSTVMMSFCSFHANRCHGDKLQFINDGPCKGDLNWAVFRARLSEKSSVEEPCGSDTCYEWETCSGTYALIRTTVHTHTLQQARVVIYKPYSAIMQQHVQYQLWVLIRYWRYFQCCKSSVQRLRSQVILLKGVNM